jgi:hypothetical protein
MVAIRVKVAAASAAASWLVVLVFVAVWLPAWADLEVVSRVARQFAAFHRDSMAGVFGSAVLYGAALMVLTWRSLVTRLWIGLSGRRPLFLTSLIPIVAVVVASVVFDLTGWRWLFAEHMAAMLWVVSVAIVAKGWLTAYAWRRVIAPYRVQYLAAWAAGTIGFVLVAMLVTGALRAAAAVDVPHHGLPLMLLAFLAIPLGRVGLAPRSLARNRPR